MHTPGAGHVDFARVGGRTVARASRAVSPLKILLPRGRGAAAWAFTSTLGGGLVDGDRVALAATLGPGAAAMLSTQSATKVYRSPRGCASELTVRAGEGSTALVLPDPVLCFEGARYEQRTRVELAPGACAVVLDVLHAGRVERGERWAFARHHAVFELTTPEGLVARDALLLDPAHGPVAARMGRFDAYATLVVAGARLERERRHVSDALGGLSAPSRGARAVASCSALADGTLVARAAAETAEGLARVVRGALAFVPALVGDDPFARKW